LRHPVGDSVKYLEGMTQEKEEGLALENLNDLAWAKKDEGYMPLEERGDTDKIAAQGAKHQAGWQPGVWTSALTIFEGANRTGEIRKLGNSPTSCRRGYLKTLGYRRRIL